MIFRRRKSEPRTGYDVLVVGDGGHALATAWFLSRQRGAGRIGVIDGGGASVAGIVGCAGVQPETVRLHAFSRSLFRRVGRHLGNKELFRADGVVRLCMTRRDLEHCGRVAATMRTCGVDARVLGAEEAHRRVPLLGDGERRFPVLGGFREPGGGVAAAAALAEAFGKAAEARGVERITGCTVQGILVEDGAVKGIETSRGVLRAEKVALAAPVETRALAATAGVILPLERGSLHGFITEPDEPVLQGAVIGGTPLVGVSPTADGALAVTRAARSTGRCDGWQALAQTTAGLLDLFPSLEHLRPIRSFETAVDFTPDCSPILGPTPVRGFFVSCGWGRGADKAIPGAGLMLATIIHDKPHPLVVPFSLERFATGRLIDETSGEA